eukprot:6662573-Alexandrium_andersonii.AAC.1
MGATVHRCELCDQLVRRRGLLHTWCQRDIDARQAQGLSRPTAAERFALWNSWGRIHRKVVPGAFRKDVPGRGDA